MKEEFKISGQGIDHDISKATGDFVAVEIGYFDEGGLDEHLRKFEAISSDSFSVGSDACPPELCVEHQGVEHRFGLNHHGLVYVNDETPVTPSAAIARIIGTSSGDAAAGKATSRKKKGSKGPAWGSDHPAVKGMIPVRRAELPPFDKNRFSRFNVDTSSHDPVVSVPVFKSDFWAGAGPLLMSFGIVALVLAGGLFATGDPVAAVVFLAAGLLMLILRSAVVKRTGMTHLRFGVDWNANALWIKKDSDKEAAIVENANCISSFVVAEKEQIRSGRFGLEHPSTGRAIEYNYKDKSWMLLAMMSNNTSRLVYHFGDKKKAEEALGLVHVLLS